MSKTDKERFKNLVEVDGETTPLSLSMKSTRPDLRYSCGCRFDAIIPGFVATFCWYHASQWNKASIKGCKQVHLTNVPKRAKKAQAAPEPSSASSDAAASEGPVMPIIEGAD